MLAVLTKNTSKCVGNGRDEGRKQGRKRGREEEGRKRRMVGIQ
jgi:hypothetical protein